MTNGEVTVRPCVMVYTLPHPELSLKQREVQAGMEEEGIPWVTEERDKSETAVLAFQAASVSRLGVGVAIGSEELCVHYYKLPVREPLFFLSGRGTPAQWRLMGSHAARLVKGIPFKELPAEQPGQEAEAILDIALVNEIVEKILHELQTRRP
ncbi:glycerol dehydratase reactivase beta/small subunit family protein [Acetonema longum]|uniref:Dehydratase medium subunit n=1 Tax=Acetonema longum DSM 6540 TaxID=1009370 RepID=F7NH20_9FIRM|nr:glycerol dehydratase reactivase beta/small subunit family protein [Acetonema longum]EGO64751.1 hypothetical protein ALO_06818 [Acetonema longum DSM 6540]